MDKAQIFFCASGTKYFYLSHFGFSPPPPIARPIYAPVDREVRDGFWFSYRENLPRGSGGNASQTVV